jgi:hypothetical protein
MLWVWNGANTTGQTRCPQLKLIIRRAPAQTRRSSWHADATAGVMDMAVTAISDTASEAGSYGTVDAYIQQQLD